MFEQVQRCYNRYKYTARQWQWQWPYCPTYCFSILPRIVIVIDRDNFFLLNVTGLSRSLTVTNLVTVNDRDKASRLKGVNLVFLV